MKKVLNIISSPRGEVSYSNKLGNAIIEKINAEYPGSTLTIRDLSKNTVPHIDASHLEAFFTPADKQTEIHKQATTLSDELVAELFGADVIVINIPMWNFSMPSVLKAWIDHVSRAGKTFKYSENGPVGLVTEKKVYLNIASGAIYSEGNYKAFDFIEGYLKALLDFLGMTDLTVYRVEGVSIPGIQDTAFEKALQSIEEKQVVNLN